MYTANFLSPVELKGTDCSGVTRSVAVSENDCGGGQLRVNSEDYTYNIAEGMISGHVFWSKFGYNDNISSSEVTITPQGGDYVFPTSGTLMSISSDSATDTYGQTTGVSGVTIYALDANYNEITLTSPVSGTTPVRISTPIFRVNNMRTSGWGDTSVGAVGNISLKDTAAGAVIYGYISAGQNRQRQLIYTVPNGKTLFITTATVYGVAGSANKWIRILLKMNYDDKSGTILPAGRVFMTYAMALMGAGGQVYADYHPPIKVLSRVDVKGQAIANTASSAAILALRGWTEVD